MEICEKELKDRRIELEREIDRLQLQLQQAQQLMQAIPLQIASRRGEIVGIDKMLQRLAEKPKPEKAEKANNKKPEKQ